jgi:hypothetical protein
MKKFLVLFFLFFLFFVATKSYVLADARPLEVKYPTVPGATAPVTTKTELPNYVKYIFNFFLWTAGFIALGVLIFAGFRYLTSAGQPQVLKDAKDQIFSALAGLLILFSSWLILNTINPQLISLTIKKPPASLPVLSAGIYLCNQEVYIEEAWKKIQEVKKLSISDPKRDELIQQIDNYLADVEKECWLVPGSTGEIDSKVNDKAIRAYVIPSETNELYGAILYDESNFQGKAQVVYILDPKAAGFDTSKTKPSSVRPFVLKQPRSGVYVEVYELIDFNRADPTKKSEKRTLSGFASSYINLSDFKDNKIGSVKIEGDLIVIFFKEEQSGDWAPDVDLDVSIQSDANLNDNIMGYWCSHEVWGLPEYYPCPKQMVIVSASIY